MPSFPLTVTHLLPPTHNLRNRMPHNRARLLRLLLRQPTGHTHFERGLGLPSRVAGVGAEAEGESFEAGD